ncbi:MAG: DUF58 domain-containing protein [Deltaproteobacteria bacterium]|nr:DUF58 domain-containing protein [Deltaproteobacteria bacterium]
MASTKPKASAPLGRDLIKKIRKIEIVTSRKAQEQLAGQYHSVFKGRGMSFDEVRPYQPGDEIRFIDWNVTARAGDVYIKRFVEERELTIMLLVDLSASLSFGTDVELKREVAAMMAGLLAFSAIDNGDRVGLILFSDRVERFVPPKKGRKHVLRCLAEILNFEPEGRGTDLAVPLEYLARVSRRQVVGFVLSDFQAPTQSFLPALRIAARRHDIVPVVVRDPMEDTLPAMGLVPFEDLEDGTTHWVDTSSRRARAAYRERNEAATKRLLGELRRNKLDAVRVRPGGAYEKALIQFFQLRAKRL